MAPEARGALVALLQLCDNLFPTGGFAHSDGLEAATSDGSVATSADLRTWMDALMSGPLEHADGVAVARTWDLFASGDWAAVHALEGELHAMRPSSTGRAASRAVGARLLTTWSTVRPGEVLSRFIEERSRFAHGTAMPVAFAVACAFASIDRRSAVEAFLYSRLAATISAAMRLMPIGQAEAHGLLASFLSEVPAVADRISASSDPVYSFAPALDIAAMSQQYVRSRLFRS